MSFEEGKYYYVKVKMAEIEDDDTTMLPYRVQFTDRPASVWVPRDAEIVEEIPEREKVVIPKFVAEWIEHCKNKTYYLSVSLQQGIDNSSQELSRWFFSKNNQNTFARAWLDGYEVEEPLGVLLLDLPEKGYWEYNYVRISENKKFFVDGSHKTSLLVENAHKVTEAEAKEKYPNFRWVSLEELKNDL